MYFVNLQNDDRTCEEPSLKFYALQFCLLPLAPPHKTSKNILMVTRLYSNNIWDIT